MGLKTTSPGLKKVVKEVAWRPGSPGKGYQAFCSDPRLADLAALGRAVRSPLCTSGGLAPAEGGQDGCCPATLGGREWGGIVLLTVSAGRANPKVKPSGAPGVPAPGRVKPGPPDPRQRGAAWTSALGAKLRSQPRAAPDPTLLIITNVPFAERDFIFAENSSEILISSHSAGPNR